MNKLNTKMQQAIDAAFKASSVLHLNLLQELIGRPVQIISDYNGQPYGRSKKSLKGKQFTVEGVHIDPHWGVSLRLREQRLYIRANEVEFL